MYEENPGVDLYRRDVYIIKSADSAKGMTDAVAKMANLAYKLSTGQEIGLLSEEGYIRRGFQKTILVNKIGAQRAVDMLVARLRGEPFETELHLPKFERAKPPAAIKTLSSAKIAIVTDGGLVPKGNPDNIERLTATRYGKYKLAGVDHLNPEDYEVFHVGYDNTPVLQDPNRLVPLDVMRDLEKEGVIGEVGENFYSTSGVATTLISSKKMGKAVAERLKEEGVDGVILTST